MHDRRLRRNARSLLRKIPSLGIFLRSLLSSENSLLSSENRLLSPESRLLSSESRLRAEKHLGPVGAYRIRPSAVRASAAVRAYAIPPTIVVILSAPISGGLGRMLYALGWVRQVHQVQHVFVSPIYAFFFHFSALFLASFTFSLYLCPDSASPLGTGRVKTSMDRDHQAVCRADLGKAFTDVIILCCQTSQLICLI